MSLSYCLNAPSGVVMHLSHSKHSIAVMNVFKDKIRKANRDTKILRTCITYMPETFTCMLLLFKIVYSRLPAINIIDALDYVNLVRI